MRRDILIFFVNLMYNGCYVIEVLGWDWALIFLVNY